MHACRSFLPKGASFLTISTAGPPESAGLLLVVLYLASIYRDLRQNMDPETCNIIRNLMLLSFKGTWTVLKSNEYHVKICLNLDFSFLYTKNIIFTLYIRPLPYTCICNYVYGTIRAWFLMEIVREKIVLAILIRNVDPRTCSILRMTYRFSPSYLYCVQQRRLLPCLFLPGTMHGCAFTPPVRIIHMGLALPLCVHPTHTWYQG